MVKLDSGHIILWIRFLPVVQDLVKIDGIMRKEDYVKILYKNLVASAHKLNLPEDDDTKPYGVSGRTMVQGQPHKSSGMAKSEPDLNPVENL